MQRITAIPIALGFVVMIAAPAAAQEDWPKRGPAKTPQPIIDRMAKALQEQMKASDVKAELSEQGAEVIGSTPAEFASYIQRETEKWAKVVEASGAKVD